MEPIGDISERGGLDLDPLLYLLLKIARMEGPVPLVEEERERVKKRRPVGRRDRTVRDPREQPLRLCLEAGLFLGLATERIEDPLAVVDPAGRQPVRAAGIKGLDRERQLSVAPSDDHTNLGEPIRSLDRVEERTDSGIDSSWSAVTGREVLNLIQVRAVEQHRTK